MRPKLTLSMIVKNEENRFLSQALLHHKQFIDNAVIIDDGSTDKTVELCKECLKDIPCKIIQNSKSQFANEVNLRKQQWEETTATDPTWILNLDADELFEDSIVHQIDDILQQTDHDAIYFRLYDMWSDTHYREDQYWSAHQRYRPFLIRYNPQLPYIWHETPQHCGRFPINISLFSYLCHPAKLKHFGWAKPEDRKMKYERYMKLDPDARYGWKEQYESILDEDPALIPWE